MEVHPPDHPIQTPRDFFLHLFTITVGLLIALSLEGLVGVVHDHRLLRQSRNNLSAELQSNAEDLAFDTRVVEQNRVNLIADLATLEAVRNHTAAPDAKLFFGWTWHGPADASWQSARDTGALALMDYDAVQRYYYAYYQQKLVTDTADTYIIDDTNIGAPLAGGRSLAQLTPQELDEMTRACSHTLMDIELLQSFMKPLANNYKQAEQ